MTADSSFEVQNGVLMRYLGKDADVAIPAGVKIIGDSSFSGCTKVQSVTIPEGVAEIGWGAFCNCNRLKRVEIPYGVLVIKSCAFKGCSKLESVTFPESLTEIGIKAFAECKSLKEVKFPRNLTILDGEAFSNCRALERIVFNRSLREISWGAFTKCDNIKTITIPKGIETINAEAFSSCKNLREVKAPYVLTIIADAFRNCKRLNRIVVSNGLDSISNIFPNTYIKSMTGVVKAYGYNPVEENGSVDIVLCSEDGETTNMVIPAYNDGREETDAFLHSCLREDNTFDFERWDSYFEKLSKNKTRMAITRMRFPYMLSEEAKQKYCSYLFSKSKQTILQCIKDNDLELLYFLGDKGLINPKSIDGLLQKASECNAAEIAAFLLEYKNNIAKPRAVLYKGLGLFNDDGSLDEICTERRKYNDR